MTASNAEEVPSLYLFPKFAKKGQGRENSIRFLLEMRLNKALTKKVKPVSRPIYGTHRFRLFLRMIFSSQQTAPIFAILCRNLSLS